MSQLSTTPEAGATAWLSQQSVKAKSLQLRMFVVRIVQLVAQLSAFWCLTSFMQLVVVEQQAVYVNQLLPFVLSMLIWALCVYYADSLLFNAKYVLENALENEVHMVLQSNQIAITRRHSASFWQQLFLNNINDIGNYLTQYSVQKWLAATGPLVVLLVIFPVNYVVGLGLLLTMPVVPLFMILVGKGAASVHRKHFVALERLGDMFSDRLKALSLISTTGQHNAQSKRLSDASDIVNRKTMKVVSLAFLSTTVLDFFSTISIALVAVFIGFTMLGELNIGPEINLHHGLFMLLVAPLLFAEMRTLGRFYHQKAKAEAAAEHFSSVFKEDLHTQPKRDLDSIAWLNFKVYQPSLAAKQLNIKKQQWVRLSGASGSGKTALLEALMGFRKATHELSECAGLLSQHACVLDNTLRFNLSLGHSDFADATLIEALEEVGLSQWLTSLPLGLDSVLSDYPALSGGEAQRLALARILIQDKSIVLLDEPTAHLTEQQHKQLSKLIRDKLKNKTVIWASHKSLDEDWFTHHWHICDGQVSIEQIKAVL